MLQPIPQPAPLSYRGPRQDSSPETDLFASDLTGPQGAPQVLARSHTSDVAADPLPTQSPTALTASQGPINATIPLPVLANAKVQLLAKQGSPDVTTLINVDVLEKESSGNPIAISLILELIVFGMVRLSATLVLTNPGYPAI